MITTFRILLLSLYPIIVFIIILEELLLHILSFFFKYSKTVILWNTTV